MSEHKLPRKVVEPSETNRRQRIKDMRSETRRITAEQHTERHSQESRDALNNKGKCPVDRATRRNAFYKRLQYAEVRQN